MVVNKFFKWCLRTIKTLPSKSYLSQQIEWASQAESVFDEVFVLGKKLVQLVDQSIRQS